MEATMRGIKGHPMGRFGALVLAAFALLIALPSTALAQIDVGDAVDGAGKTVDETVDQTTDKADEVVDTAEDTVDGTAGSEGGVVDQVTDTVDRTNEQTGQAVDDTVDDATDVAGDAAKGRISPLDETLKETAGRVGGVVDSILGQSSEGQGRERRDTSDGSAVSGSGTDRRVAAGGIDGFVSAEGASSFLSSSDTAPGSEAVRTTPASLRSPSESLIESIGEVLPRIAFPAALLILVAGYLVVQGRVDRTDPKLALAPIDMEQEFLSFR